MTLCACKNGAPPFVIPKPPTYDLPAILELQAYNRGKLPIKISYIPISKHPLRPQFFANMFVHRIGHASLH